MYLKILFVFLIRKWTKKYLLIARPIGVVLLGMGSFYKLPYWLDKSYNLEALVQNIPLDQ